MIPSVYLDLGLIVLIMATLGLLAYSTQSSKLSGRRLSGDLAELRKILERELRGLRETRPDVAKEKPVEALAQKPQVQRNTELETLRLLVLRQDDEIKMLQREADDMRRSLARLGSASTFVGTTPSPAFLGEQGFTGSQTAKPPDRTAATEWAAAVAAPAASSGSGRDLLNYSPRSEVPFPRPGEPESRVPAVSAEEVAGWKENLDGILSMLDAMEREVQN